jgi:hypothetical protein
MKGFMMTLTKILERFFPKTMHRYWWKSRETGRKYGVNQALFVLMAEMKRLQKEQDVPVARVKAKEQARYLATVIRMVKELNAK